jgi:DNA polymerase III delta prime subunit
MLLEKIISHATILIGDINVYDNLKKEILGSGDICLNFDYDPEDKETKSLKLEHLTEIKNFLSSKSVNTRYIITNKNMRKTELQNAMLKMLEEADESTKIIFVVESINYFLPTILSRMQVLDSNHLILGDSKNPKNIFSIYKKKTILEKNFKELERIVKLEDLYTRNLISDKQLNDYLSMV